MASLLIADDDPDIRFLLRRKVEAAAGPLSVVGEAASGDEAVEMWRRLRPDAIVLNQRMPGLTGLEAAAQILGEHPDQVIILFSGFRDDEMERASAELGIRACLAKSDLPRLIDVLLEHLNLAPAAEIDVSDRDTVGPPEVDVTETPERNGSDPQ